MALASAGLPQIIHSGRRRSLSFESASAPFDGGADADGFGSIGGAFDSRGSVFIAATSVLECVEGFFGTGGGDLEAGLGAIGIKRTRCRRQVAHYKTAFFLFLEGRHVALYSLPWRGGMSMFYLASAKTCYSSPE